MRKEEDFAEFAKQRFESKRLQYPSAFGIVSRRRRRRKMMTMITMKLLLMIMMRRRMMRKRIFKMLHCHWKRMCHVRVKVVCH